MSWHFYLMIILSVLYLSWKIYVYSTSITFNYWLKPGETYKEHTKFEWFKINCKRKIKEFKYILKSYWNWYGFKHIWPIIITWLIYGGIFMW